MAIKFGMTLSQIFNQLVRGYQKITGAEPKGLDLIKIKQEAMQRFKDMNKVVDMEGTPIDPSKGIMGGKQIKEITEDTGEGFINFVRKTDPEGAAKLQKEEDRIRAMIEAANKKAAKNLKDKKKKLDDPEDMAQGGRAGFKEGLRAKLMKPFKIDRGTLRSMFFNKNNPIITGFNTSELFDLALNLSSLPGLAEGGRIGYKDGPEKPGRRTFMKAAAGLASLLPFGLGKVSKVAAPVVTKAAEITGPALAKLVDTVMSAGKLISVTGKRVKEMVTKKKLGKVEVEEDIADGSYIIKKDGKEIYYKPGKMDETGGIEDDIIEVIENRVKKASGGIGYMLGE